MSGPPLVSSLGWDLWRCQARTGWIRRLQCSLPRTLSGRDYAGGRTMSTALLQETFQSLLTPAKQLQQQYLPQIEQKAQSLDLGQVMSLVRGA